MLQKNDIYEMYIEDIGNDGEGIGHIDGMAVFVKGALIGDTINVKIIKVKKNLCYGRVDSIIKESPYRTEPRCEISGPCGGCTLMHMDYKAQLDYKQNKVKNVLTRIGGLTDVESIMEEPHGMEDPYHFRNKMQFPVGRSKDGKIVVGFYASHSHDIIPQSECVTGHAINTYITKAAIRFMELYNISTYNETEGTGLVRHIVTRVGFHTGELMVVVVINGDDLPHRDELVKLLNAAVFDYNDSLSSVSDDEDSSTPEKKGKITLESVQLNINKEKGNRILGYKSVPFYGKERITDYIGRVRFEISPLSFYQVNPCQTERLYGKVLEYADLSGSETVWDMYCGIGTISLFLADKAKKVYGVEIVDDAIKDARLNAKINGIENAEFFTGKAEEIVPECFSKGISADVVVVDPPRKGCDEKLLRTISDMSPEKMVYVSCDPATLARDLKLLTTHGFEVKRVAVYDQFCHSGHVETVVLLGWKDVDEYMYVDYEPDHHIVEQGKATYREVTEYVQEKYGFHVTNLNIAQVKDKCGFEKRENYNKGAEGHKVPQVTEEKEKAILDAFKHFGML